MAEHIGVDVLWVSVGSELVAGKDAIADRTAHAVNRNAANVERIERVEVSILADPVGGHGLEL